MRYLNKLFWMSPYRCTKMPTLFPFFSIYILTFYIVHHALISHKTVILLYKKIYMVSATERRFEGFFPSTFRKK